MNLSIYVQVLGHISTATALRSKEGDYCQCFHNLFSIQSVKKADQQYLHPNSVFLDFESDYPISYFWLVKQHFSVQDFIWIPVPFQIIHQLFLCENWCFCQNLKNSSAGFHRQMRIIKFFIDSKMTLNVLAFSRPSAKPFTISILGTENLETLLQIQCKRKLTVIFLLYEKLRLPRSVGASQLLGNYDL